LLKYCRNKYVTRSPYSRALVPVYWDNGYQANHQRSLFDRAAATQAMPTTISETVNAAR
jgi:endoglucanase